MQFWQFFLQMGSGTHQLGPMLLAILGVGQRVGSELQCTGANMAAAAWGQVAVRRGKHGP